MSSYPKIELHVHFEGACSAELLFACARSNGVSLPVRSPEELRAFMRFADFGELSAEWFRGRKVRGAVIDGSTRDAASIARTRFPTFVRYRSPQDSVPRWRVTDWGQPLTVGGVRVSLGDIVVGDLDGVVVVPRRVAHEVLQRCERLVGTENKVRTAVKRGMTPLAAYEKFGAF